MSNLKQVLTFLGLKQIASSILHGVVSHLPRYQICTRAGVKYHCDLDELIDRSIFMYGAWESETVSWIRQNVFNGSFVVEVGANVGAHTLQIAKHVGDSGHVHAFEPTLYAFEKLKLNLRLNPDLKKRVTLHPNIVADSNMVIDGKRIISSWSFSGPKDLDKSLVLPECQSTTIDSFAFDKVDIIKIDVDGYDYKVLRGARETIARFTPLIFIELCKYSLSSQGDCINDIFAFMNEFGYACKTPYGRNITVAEVLKLVGDNSSINGVFECLVCHPKLLGKSM